MDLPALRAPHSLGPKLSGLDDLGRHDVHILLPEVVGVVAYLWSFGSRAARVVLVLTYCSQLVLLQLAFFLRFGNVRRAPGNTSAESRNAPWPPSLAPRSTWQDSFRTWRPDFRALGI